MADYLHGAYGNINAASTRQTQQAESAMVVVGTAPVHTIAGGADTASKPILVRNMTEAKKLLGYSDDWASYTLCEAMHVFFDLKGVGPLVFINVLDPDNASHKSGTQATVSKTPSGGAFTISSAKNIILDSVVIQTTDQTPVTKVKGTDYSISYSANTETITVAELASGALGTDALNVKYYTILPSGVTASDVVGTTDGCGTNTGLYAVQDVYQLTGAVPAFIMAPGFSGNVGVHDAMYNVSQKINKHWDAYIFTDIPIVANNTPVTIQTAATYKTSNSFNHANESTYFPMAKGTDGNNYHLSVLAAANLLEILIDNGGVPYRSASNTDCEIIQELYLGEDSAAVVTDELINEYLNRNGINSAAFVSGRWAIWGAHCAAYDQNNANNATIFETSTMMLYYVSNDFQARRAIDVDVPMTANGLRSIVSEEQTRLDALVKIGALTYGLAKVDAESLEMSDVVNGDFTFEFDVTTTPLAKSLTAVVNWSDEGFVTYFEAFNG